MMAPAHYTNIVTTASNLLTVLSAVHNLCTLSGTGTLAQHCVHGCGDIVKKTPRLLHCKQVKQKEVSSLHLDAGMVLPYAVASTAMHGPKL
jgi:hypothetical protein